MADPIRDGLTAYWNEAAARERAKPPADKPTHAEVLQYGEAFAPAPSDRAVWTVHDGSTGTFIGRWRMGHFFIEEAGDLWPSKPSHWLSRERAAEIAATRAPPQPAGDET